tara:strand:- start:15065 stop:15256 length:192 start_codon:yes stop_codon:yes gene_type:complete
MKENTMKMQFTYSALVRFSSLQRWPFVAASLWSSGAFASQPAPDAEREPTGWGSDVGFFKIQQ